MGCRTLVLCHGNKGRSQGFCAIQRYLAANDGREDLVFESAGVCHETIKSLRANGRDKTSSTVVRILREQGVPIEERPIRHISEVEGPFDYILTAEMKQKEYFQGSSVIENVYAIREFAEGVRGDVFDAHQLVDELGIGSEDPCYDVSYRIMCWGLRRLAEGAYGRIVQENPPSPSSTAQSSHRIRY